MKLVTLATSIFMLTSTVSAQDWRGLENQVKCNESFSDYGTINLLDSIGVEVKDNGSGTFTIRKVIKIQKKSAELTNRIIKYDYDPLTAFAKFTSVKLYKNDGSIVNVDVAKANDYAAPARSIYWGARQIMIEIGRLEPGDVIDYTIDKKGFTYALLKDMPTSDESRFIPPMSGQYYDIVPFWVNEPTVKKVYRVSIPKSKEVQYEFYQGECSTSIRQDKTNNIFQFVKMDVLPFKTESNMVNLFDVAPKLMMSTTPTWEDKSKWFYGVNEDYGSFDAHPETQKMVDKLTKNCKTNMEKIAVLTHWVADNIRYSGISMGKGEGYTLHNTEMNFVDRAGVCKDKAALLISMLRMAGLESYPAMTMAGSRIESIPADHFNHCVTVVKTDEGVYIPLDPTWVPFNRELWSSAEQQQNYLPGTPEPSGLCLTPISAPENHYFRLNSTSSLKSDGTLVGVVTVEAEGQSDAAVRRPFTTGYRSLWRSAMEMELMNVSPEAKLISVDYGKDPKDYQKSAIEITFKYEIPNYAIVGDDEMIFKPLTMSSIYNSVRSHLHVNTSVKNRKYSFKDACSRLIELKEEITLPSGYTLVQKDKSENHTSSAADFSGSIDMEGNKIVMTQTLALKKRVYDAVDWDGYRTAVDSHKSFGEELVIKK